MLDRELAAYRARPPELLEHEGKWCVVKGDVASYPFESYEAALAFGYGWYGLVPFFVRRIERTERPLWFSRSV
jgi:hypothetical protein